MCHEVVLSSDNLFRYMTEMHSAPQSTRKENVEGDWYNGKVVLVLN
jgi:hypothetical protein